MPVYGEDVAMARRSDGLLLQGRAGGNLQSPGRLYIARILLEAIAARWL